jgi:glutamyl-tRNA reductase
MIRLCTEYLSKLNPREMIIANRTLQKGEMLAKKYGGKAITIAAIPDYLPLVDIVISCTASQLPMIGKGLVERIMRQRSRPLMFVDLGMPRDIEPEVSQLPQITLFNIDDIQHVVESHLEQRKEACHYALHIIEEELQGFLAWQNMRKAAVPMIVAYRSHMESVRDKEIQKALQGLKNGKSAEEMIKKLGKDLTQRLIHTPTLEMRQMAAQGKTDMLEFVKELLKINV